MIFTMLSIKKYGAIGSNANILVFSDDDQFPLLRSIENGIKNPDGTKRPLKKHRYFIKQPYTPELSLPLPIPQ